MRVLFLFLLSVLASCQPKNHDAATLKTRPLNAKNVVAYNAQKMTAEHQKEINPPETEKLNFVICLDAGHGGYDTGTRRKKAPLLSEKFIALDLVFALKKALIPLGYQVILTREKDLAVSLPDRVLFAHKKNAILFVSIHCNWAKNTVSRGTEVFYFAKKNDLRSNLSKKAAECCLRHISLSTGLPSRGVKHGNFYVVRETLMPAILIESGFFSNGEDALFLKQKANRIKLAKAVARGIDDFCRLER